MRLSRKLRRDAVSKQALRRMAYQVRRVPGMRAVLHDALLEAFPREYEKKIDLAEKAAQDFGWPHIVMFNPRGVSDLTLDAVPQWIGHRFLVFDGDASYLSNPWAPGNIDAIRRSAPSRSDLVLVYITGSKRKTTRWKVFQDPPGSINSIRIQGPVGQHVIVYNDGRVGYDRPEQVPAYVKKKVERLAKRMRETPVKGLRRQLA